MKHAPTIVALGLAFVGTACGTPEIDPPPEVIHARFDPDARVIPMPTDILRDEERGMLDIDLDGADTDAEREFFTFLNTLDGWSSAMSATVEFTGPIDLDSVNAGSLEVWHMRATPTRVTDITFSLDETETVLTIDPPRTGWERGGRYSIVLRGGPGGIRGLRAERVEADAAFYFLRLTEPLDTPEHERAFPGQTREERQQKARDLEEVRLELAGDFEFFENRGIERAEIASLFSFTITERVELAMDKASQRMPLPIDLLINPATSLIELPPAPWDSHTVLDAKEKLNRLDGFGTSAKLLFGFTGEIDPATVSDTSVALYDLGAAVPRRLDAAIVVLDDRLHIEVEPSALPLTERHRYALAITEELHDADGRPVIAMPVGHFLAAESPVADGERSLVGAIDDEDAVKLEKVRGELGHLWTALDRDDVVAAWSFTTMSIAAPLADELAAAAAIGVSLDPQNVSHMSAGQALLDFPLSIASLFFVDDVYHGTIEVPDFIDPLTRGWRGDGQHAITDVSFTITLPDAAPGETVPVVIFGHGVMTERRFVLAIGDALAARGFAAISIDFPFHGERTHCFAEGPLTIPNPTTGELTPLGNPCADGGECQPDGTCRAAGGGPGELARWPIIGMYMSSGAAYLEIEKISNTRDHFRQSVIDLKALHRSLSSGDWLSQVGVTFDPDQIYYAGQSLGGIIGATYLAHESNIVRSVLNVPGADTVDLFRESPFFSGQIEAFFNREGVEPESFDGHRFLNVARWLMDSVDPQSFADNLRGRDIMLQMATLDFIIPNDYTVRLEELTGLPRRDYVGEHAFLVIPVEPAYFRGTRELAEYLQGDFQP